MANEGGIYLSHNSKNKNDKGMLAGTLKLGQEQLHIQWNLILQYYLDY